MDENKNLLKMRETYLTQLKKEKEKELLSAPEGTLRICDYGKRTQYYHRMNPADRFGTYIRGSNRSMIQTLAQKEYNKKVLRAAEKELCAIKKYQASMPAATVEQIYEQLHKERQKLITPVREPEDQYVQNWIEVEYTGKRFDENVPEFYTAKGERVRSKSEVIIADALNREGIPYRYECPVLLRGIGKIYPDFTVLDVSNRKELYWEHLGKMDDEAYAENAVQRILAYEQNGIFPGDNLILTYETRKNPLNQKQILIMIQKYLRDKWENPPFKNAKH